VKPAKPAKPARVAQDASRKKQANDYVDAPRAGSAPGTLRCPSRAPIAERVPLASGGTVILCVSRAGLVGAATLPDVAVASQPRRATTATPAAAPRSQTPKSAPLRLTLTEPDDGIDLVKPVVPKGYKLAWQDDRLNARRAQGTDRGQAQQDLVWTRETPARLVTRTERARMREEDATLTLSTKGAPAKPRYVQVGSFGDPANAQAASARLSGLGLPVAKSRAKSNGRQLQVVLAGPFSSEADATAALRALRRGGFPDAVIR
jgi:cell division protein FtsN